MEKVNETVVVVAKKRGRPPLSEEEKARRAKEREEVKKVVNPETGEVEKTSANAMTTEGKSFAITDYGFGKTYEVSKVVFENEEGHVVEKRVFQNPITMNTNKIGSKMVTRNGTKYVIVSLDESKEDLTFIVKAL